MRSATADGFQFSNNVTGRSVDLLRPKAVDLLNLYLTITTGLDSIHCPQTGGSLLTMLFGLENT